MGIVFFLSTQYPISFLTTQTIFVLGLRPLQVSFPLTTIRPFSIWGDTGCLVYQVHDFCLVLARFEKCNGSCGSHPMIILRVPITDTFCLSDPIWSKNFINRIAITCTTDLGTSGNCTCDLWVSMIFSLISLLLNISRSHWGVSYLVGLLFGVELLAGVSWGFRATSSPLLNVLLYREFFLPGGSPSKTEKKN